MNVYPWTFEKKLENIQIAKRAINLQTAGLWVIINKNSEFQVWKICRIPDSIVSSYYCFFISLNIQYLNILHLIKRLCEFKSPDFQDFLDLSLLNNSVHNYSFNFQLNKIDSSKKTKP
ncbi:hypothetical protein BpHYR1_026618 [Brachionus plicatilis]|uniref:Uncharacterized protein n=1 Tax=Brachionus plicatilis TaxID=10195 RepID=A0A3M7T8B0_BRAPC|nr:hypothetical protein BpHYR1_026618 [Brachionus plicatilis]